MRSLVLTVVSAFGGGLFMWLMASWGAGNLKPGQRPIVEIMLLTVAVLASATSGALIGRRSDRSHIILFGATAGAIAGGVCGAMFALIMGIAYVSTFGGAPVGFIDGVVVLLSYPVFALLGAAVGAVPGGLLGASGGYLAAHVAPVAPRAGLR